MSSQYMPGEISGETDAVESLGASLFRRASSARRMDSLNSSSPLGGASYLR